MIKFWRFLNWQGVVRASVIVRGCKIGRGEAVGFACERGVMGREAVCYLRQT